jgi:hypothetical protein
MSEFKSDLCTKLKETNDSVWVLTESLIYDSDLVGQIIVPEGFQTDLASVPRIPLIYSLWGSRAHREAVIHDYLYRMDSNPIVEFGMANSVFLEAMKVRGKSWYICYPMYWGVCLGAHGCFHIHKVDDLL